MKLYYCSLYMYSIFLSTYLRNIYIIIATTVYNCLSDYMIIAIHFIISSCFASCSSSFSQTEQIRQLENQTK